MAKPKKPKLCWRCRKPYDANGNCPGKCGPKQLANLLRLGR